MTLWSGKSETHRNEVIGSPHLWVVLLGSEPTQSNFKAGFWSLCPPALGEAGAPSGFRIRWVSTPKMTLSTCSLVLISEKEDLWIKDWGDWSPCSFAASASLGSSTAVQEVSPCPLGVLRRRRDGFLWEMICTSIQSLVDDLDMPLRGCSCALSYSSPHKTLDPWPSGHHQISAITPLILYLCDKLTLSSATVMFKSY